MNRPLINLFFIIASCSFLHAQDKDGKAVKIDDKDAGQVFQYSLEYMKAGDWKGASKLISKFIGHNSDEKAAIKTYGPKFGWFHYHYGFCEDKLGNYGEAIKGFKACYEKFPNKGDNGLNAYREYSLYKWGEAAYSQKDYKEAKTQFERFLKEKDPKNPQNEKYPKAKFYTHYGISQMKTGELKKGIQTLEIAFQKRNEFLTSPSLMYEGFNVVCEETLRSANEGELLKFLDKNKHHLLGDMLVSSQYSKVILSHANSAINSGMRIAGLELLTLVPHSQTAKDTLKAQLKGFEGSKFDGVIRDGYIQISPKITKNALKKLDEDVKKGQSNEAFHLSMVAGIWERAGNYRASYAALKNLVTRFPQSGNHEVNLFRLMQSANNIGKIEEVGELGTRYLEKYPNGAYVKDVKRMMVLGLYFNGEYADCVEVASGQIDSLEKGSPAHDSCLYALGGSYYYLSDYGNAVKNLSEHVKDYPESRFNAESSYLEAAALNAIGRYPEAGAKLDVYLEKYKDAPNGQYPFALFERANNHYATAEYDQAIVHLDTLESRFKRSAIMPNGYVLRGNIHFTEEDDPEAEKYYKIALEEAKARVNNLAAGEAISSLINVITANKDVDRSAEAVAYYDEFWKKYAEGSPFQSNVAVTGFPALLKQGRKEDGLDQMRKVIVTAAKTPGQPDLEKLVNSYRDAYLESYSVAELKDHFYNFEGIDRSDREALALLRISLIGAFEKEITQADKEKKENRVIKLNADIKTIFTDLKNDFKPTELTPFTLFKIGDFIRNSTSTPREALDYFEEILTRDGQQLKVEAEYGIGDILGGSPNAQETAKSKQILAKLAADENVPDKQKAKAAYRLLKVHEAKGEWQEALDVSLAYIDNKNFRSNRAEVTYIQGLSADKLGKTEQALSAYTRVFGSFAGDIRYSAPSVKRQMQILWKRNNPAEKNDDGVIVRMSDKQGAYDIGERYINGSRRHFEKMTPEEQKLWLETEEIFQEYENSGQITKKERKK